MSHLINAKLVYDGGSDVQIPSELGTPRDDQMQGTPGERLIELAGRTCYDSLGKGRPSFTVGDRQGYHDHIRQVGHGSVWEHFNFTIQIPLPSGRKEFGTATRLRRVFSMATMNHPGVLTFHNHRSLRVTLNARSVNEWLRWEQELYGRTAPLAKQFAAMVSKLGNQLLPHVISPIEIELDENDALFPELLGTKVVEPKGAHEQWISMFVSGSRGLSHELVRHGDFTAISQRSTRYVDESESDWVEHPLISEFVGDASETGIPGCKNDVLKAAKAAYRVTVCELEASLLDRQVDAQTARKQARGAARGFLGNALYTELIFSANVAQWKRMLRQRASVHADAEIRELFCKALPELKRSRYGDQFADWQLERSPDGIGCIAREMEKDLVA